MAGILFESYYGTSQLGEPYLMHHGIKGQKWGKRRWQHEDGSLTPAGREHYGYGSSQKYRNSDGSLTDAGKKRYDRQVKKLGKLKDRTDVDLQKEKAQQYEKRASIAGKVAVGSGLAAAGLAGVNPLNAAIVKRHDNNGQVYRDLQKSLNPAYTKLAGAKSYDEWKSVRDGIDHTRDLIRKASDKIDRENGFLFNASEALDKVSVIAKPAVTAAVGATAAVSAGVYAYNKIQGHLANKRVTDIGHEKAVEKYEAYRKKFEEEYGNVALSELDKLQHSDDDYLMHHGIKGQKWGIRRWQNEDGSLTPAGREHYGYGDQKTSSLDLSSVTDPYDDKQVAEYYNFKLYDKYLKKAKDVNEEHRAAYSSIMNEIQNAHYDGDEHVKKAIDKALKDHGYYDDDPEDPEKTLLNEVLTEYKTRGKVGGLLDMSVFWNYANDVHPEFSELTDRWLKSYYNDTEAIGRQIIKEKGRGIFDKQVDLLNEESKERGGKHFEYRGDKEIAGLMGVYLRRYAETLEHADDYIEHHGIKGQKWYHRRFQNEDGSLTTLGRLHYGIGKGRKEEGAKELVEAYDKKRKEEKATAKAAKAVVTKEKLLTSGNAKQILENSDMFTNQELQQAVNRLNMKRQLASLEPPKKSIVAVTTGLLNTAGSAMNAITNVKDAYEKMQRAFESDEDKEKRKAKERQEAREEAAEEGYKLALKKHVQEKAKEAMDDSNDSVSSKIKKAIQSKNDDLWAEPSKSNSNDVMDRIKQQVEASQKARIVKSINDSVNADNQRRENDAFISKLSSVSNKYESEREAQRQSDKNNAYDRIRKLMDSSESSGDSSQHQGGGVKGQKWGIRPASSERETKTPSIFERAVGSVATGQSTVSSMPKASLSKRVGNLMSSVSDRASVDRGRELTSSNNELLNKSLGFLDDLDKK